MFRGVPGNRGRFLRQALRQDRVEVPLWSDGALDRARRMMGRAGCTR